MHLTIAYKSMLSNLFCFIPQQFLSNSTIRTLTVVHVRRTYAENSMQMYMHGVCINKLVYIFWFFYRKKVISTKLLHDITFLTHSCQNDLSAIHPIVLCYQQIFTHRVKEIINFNLQNVLIKYTLTYMPFNNPIGVVNNLLMLLQTIANT